jgi:cell division protein FtsA
MRQQTRIVAAVDIGTTKIVTIVGRLNERNKLEILALKKEDSRGVKRGVVFNIEDVATSIRKTLADVEHVSGVKLDDVFVGIAGQHIRSFKNRGYINREMPDNDINAEDVKKLTDEMYKISIESGEEILHVIPETYIVDNEYGILNPIGMSGRRLEGNFNIVVGQVLAARNIEKCITRVGLNMNTVILEPLASAAAVLTEDEKEAGVALLDIGGGTSDLAIYHDKTLRHVAVIPFGGNVITNDIKTDCQLLQKQAEILKVKYGSALGESASDDKYITIPGISGREPKEISLQRLAYVIQSRMEEILDGVMYEIDKSGYRDKLSAGMVLTGGGALLKHLPQLVNYQTGYDSRIGFPIEHTTSDNAENYNHPAYATAVGLLITGLEWLQKNERKVKKAEVETASKPEAKIQEPEIEDDEPVEKPRLRIPILENLKKTFSEIFDESNDTKL